MVTKRNFPIEKSLISPKATIKEGLALLAESPFQIIFTANSPTEIIGCITDGDIRRGFLSGESLNSSLERVARKGFLSAKQGASSKKVYEILRKHGIRQVPILSEDGRLVDIKTLEDFLVDHKLDIPAVIMAGGKGKRLLPFTETVPKPLLKVGDKTIIETLITNLKLKGITEFFVSVNYLAEQVIEHLGDGSRFGVTINYIREDESLGTAGSLFYLKDKINTEFIVINGDVITTLDLDLFSQFHREHNSIATLCAKIFNIKLPYGVVNLSKNKSVLNIEEKPNLSFTINSGIYYFSPKVFDFIKSKQVLDMPEFFTRLVQEGMSVKCFESTDPWIDIGTHEEFEKAKKYLEYLTTFSEG